MEVFISWSGKRSKQVAEILQTWIPCIIHEVNTFLSSEDIEKGSRWSSSIGDKLEKCNIGIICVTTDNIYSPWLNFEAGAISKKISSARVCTFLCDLSTRDIPMSSPLMQFQATSPTREDFFRLIRTINITSNVIIKDDILEKTYDRFWGDIQKDFESCEHFGTDKTSYEENSVSKPKHENLIEKTGFGEQYTLEAINSKLNILLKNRNMSCSKMKTTNCQYFRKKIECWYRVLNDEDFTKEKMQIAIEKYILYTKQIITISHEEIDGCDEFKIYGTLAKIHLVVEIADIVFGFTLGLTEKNSKQTE